MVFLFIMLVILIFTLIMITAKVELKIVNLSINSQRREHISNGYQVIIKLKILEKIPVIKITLTKKKMEKIQKSLKMNEKIEQLEKEILQNKNEFDMQMIKGVKEAGKGIYIEKLDLEIEGGTENAFLTSILVAVFSTILSIGFSKMHINENRVFYKIKPIYANQNCIKIEISGIFQIKVIHIINTIYVFNKKRGGKKHERTSNRRSYDYGYE